MKGKEIAIAGVFIFFILPILIKILFFTMESFLNPGQENIEKGAELIAEASIPWWIELIQWFAELPGSIGAFLIIGLIFFLMWIGEIKQSN